MGHITSICKHLLNVHHFVFTIILKLHELTNKHRYIFKMGIATEGKLDLTTKTKVDTNICMGLC